MKEMRLFEIGLKDAPHSTGYTYKYYVAADDAHEAEDKARGYIIEDYVAWWEEEGRDMEIADMKSAEEDPTVPALDKVLQPRLDELRELHLAKLLDIGTLIV